MDDDNTDSNDKPRRLEEETTNYLRQIELQFTDKLDQEEKQILVENVLSEIKTRTASATCDRNTNFLMEKICYAADLKNLLEITRRCSPYGVFLARNRYSSHVLQALIARFCFILKFEDFGDIESSEVRDTIVEFVRPIMKEISWLGRETSASHVLRSLFSLLTGMPVIAERKGKNSKHQHSISLSEPLDSLMEAGRFYINKSVCFSVPEVFHDILVEAVNGLLSVPAREIQIMIADASCCAVLGLLVRILSNKAIVSDERGPELALRLFRLALEWDEDDNEVESARALAKAADTFYAMAGDRSGSYFLESLIECASVPFLAPLLAGTIVGKAKEYADDNAANFVLQAILRRLSAEQKRASEATAAAATGEGSSSKKKSSHKKEQQALHDISEALFAELTQPEIFAALVASKGGVVLWLLDLAHYQSEERWAEVVGLGLLDQWIAAEKVVTEDPSYDIKPRELQLVPVWNKRFTAAAAAAAAASAESEEAKKGGPNGNKGFKGKPAEKPKGPEVDTAQLLLSRLIGYLLKSRVAAVQVAAGGALSKLYPDTLRYIAMSGPISRAMMDEFFAHFQATNEFKALGASLCTSAVELADHYVGQHILRRSFECSDLRGKEKWAMALSVARDKLVVRKEGRASLAVVSAELYAKDAAEWRSLMKKQAKAAQMLAELETDTPSAAVAQPAKKVDAGRKVNTAAAAAAAATAAGASAPAESMDVDEEEGKAAGAAGAGRKRKRKRNNANRAGAANEDADE